LVFNEKIVLHLGFAVRFSLSLLSLDLGDLLFVKRFPRCFRCARRRISARFCRC
jgi:hypothetical protein